ncbi:MAG: HAMP domain-containing protein [Dehalococcoidia bacterium]|nr:HAMP domain-containing protein [Dehalococcoidia bacterium]MSQ17632.1 HAMP domain-containing protein [Dehalococcoidia bacterium]
MALTAFGRRPRFRLGIAALLTLGMVTLIITLVGLATALEIQRHRATLYQELEQRGQILAATLEETLAAPLYFFDVDALDSNAKLLLKAYGATEVQVFDPQGRLLADPSAQTVGHQDKFRDPFITGALQSGQLQSRWRFQRLQVAGPVIVGREVIGGFEFELDAGGVTSEIRAMTLRRIWEGLAMAVAGAIVAFAVAQYVARPIRRLSQATQRIGGGELSIQRGDPPQRRGRRPDPRLRADGGAGQGLPGGAGGARRRALDRQRDAGSGDGRAPAGGSPVPAGPGDGERGPAGRRRGPRLQQPADGDSRLLADGHLRCAGRPSLRSAFPGGGEGGPAGGRPHPPAPGLLPPPDCGSEGGGPQPACHGYA